MKKKQPSDNSRPQGWHAKPESVKRSLAEALKFVRDFPKKPGNHWS